MNMLEGQSNKRDQSASQKNAKYPICCSNYEQCSKTESDFTIEKLCDKAEKYPVTQKKAKSTLQFYRNAKTDKTKEVIGAY